MTKGLLVEAQGRAVTDSWKTPEGAPRTARRVEATQVFGFARTTDAKPAAKTAPTPEVDFGTDDALPDFTPVAEPKPASNKRKTKNA